MFFPVTRRKKKERITHTSLSKRNDPTCLNFVDCLVDVRRVYGNCLEGVWQVSGGCMEGVLRVSGQYLEGVLSASVGYLLDVLMVIW